MALRPAWFYSFAVLASLAALASGCNRPQPQVAEVQMPAGDELKERLDRAIAFTRDNRHLNTKDQAAWQIVHGALAYGSDFEIYNDGQLVPAMAFLLNGGRLRGWDMRKGDHGVKAVLDPGSKTGQGHPDQWLGYLSQCGLTLDEPLVVSGGEKYQVRDLLTQAQWDVYDGMEATWTLMAFCTYLPQGAEWTAQDGSKWTIARIAKMEADQSLDTSACGGTHRMYALATALNRFYAGGGSLEDDPTGTWKQVSDKIGRTVALAREYQQPDGSFSTNYFSRAARSAEIDSRISTTGHVLEFLTVALDDQQLQQPWVTRAVLHLVDCLEKTQKFDLECGALYHAVHGLKLYRERCFGAEDSATPAAPEEPVAAQEAINR